MDPSAHRVHSQHAVAVYAEPLVAGGCVAVFGDASLGLPARLMELGARVVYFWDPDELRAMGEARLGLPGVRVVPYPFEIDEAPPADVALIPDLAEFDDPAEVLSLVRRLVGGRGVAVIGAENRDVVRPGRFDYYELFDLVAREFESVRMVAELPFHGVALVELGEQDESPQVSVDTQLVEEERAPRRFIAIASQEDVRLEPYAILELPAPEPEAPPPPIDAAAEPSPLVRELQSELASRARQLAELSSQVEEMRAAAEAGQIAAAEIQDLGKRADRAERRVASLEQEVARGNESYAAELARFEEALRERAQAARVLERELAHRDRMVRDLVGALEEAGQEEPGSGETTQGGAPVSPASAPEQAAPQALLDENARLRERLDALALDLARREGESQATAWTVAELQKRLENPPTPPVPAPPAEGDDAVARLRAALDELDVLRRALAQEHAERLKAESGEELAGARAEIQRQAALLERMARELESRGGMAAAADRPD